MLFHDEASALRVFEVGRMCEPPPGLDAIIMANSLINRAPMVIGVTDPTQRQKLADFAYRISRGLIGDTMADAFRFPRGRLLTLPIYRLRNRMERLIFRWPTGPRGGRDLKRFQELLDFVNLGRTEHSYALPTPVHDDDSAEW